MPPKPSSSLPEDQILSGIPADPQTMKRLVARNLVENSMARRF
jgi:hypothetical protein